MPIMDEKRKGVLFICLGNICRSVAAHAVMEQINREQKLGWHIDSCGTSGYHRGARPDSRMMAALKQHGYAGFSHRAQQFVPDMAYQFDLLLAMDLQNYRDVQRTLKPHKEAIEEQTGKPLASRLRLFREFDPEVSERAEVPDPYYNGGKHFGLICPMIIRTCFGIIRTCFR